MGARLAQGLGVQHGELELLATRSIVSAKSGLKDVRMVHLVSPV